MEKHPRSNTLTPNGIINLFWLERSSLSKQHALLEPSLLQVVDLQFQQLRDIKLITLSDGVVKITVRITGNARLLVEKGTGQPKAGYVCKFDIVAVPISAVRLACSPCEEVRGNPWLQALIISDLVVKNKEVGRMVGSPIDLNAYKENPNNAQGSNVIEVQQKCDLSSSTKASQVPSSVHLPAAASEETKEGHAAEEALPVEKEGAQPVGSLYQEMLGLIEEEEEAARRRQLCYESLQTMRALKLPRLVNYKAKVNFLSPLIQKRKHFISFSLVNRQKQYIDCAGFGQEAPRFHQQLRAGKWYRFRNVTCRQNNLRPERLELILQRESVIEQVVDEELEVVDLTSFEDAKQSEVAGRHSHNLNVIGTVRTCTSNLRNRNLQLANKLNDFLTLTIWDQHKDKAIQVGSTYLFMNMRKVRSKLDRQELSSNRSTLILPEEEARRKYRLNEPAVGLKTELHSRQQQGRQILPTLRNVLACQTNGAAFAVRAMITFPTLQHFSLRNLFQIRCKLCKVDPFDFKNPRCRNCDQELDVKFNVMCELVDEHDTLTADLSTFALEKELGLPAADALELFNSNQVELAARFRQLEYKEALVRLLTTIAANNRRYFKVSSLHPDSPKDVARNLQIVRENLGRLALNTQPA